jgi:hypothetical protein
MGMRVAATGKELKRDSGLNEISISPPRCSNWERIETRFWVERDLDITASLQQLGKN